MFLWLAKLRAVPTATKAASTMKPIAIRSLPPGENIRVSQLRMIPPYNRCNGS